MDSLTYPPLQYRNPGEPTWYPYPYTRFDRDLYKAEGLDSLLLSLQLRYRPYRIEIRPAPPPTLSNPEEPDPWNASGSATAPP